MILTKKYILYPIVPGHYYSIKVSKITVFYELNENKIVKKNNGNIPAYQKDKFQEVSPYVLIKKIYIKRIGEK